MSVAGIVLAAGFSRRLGRPKQTVELGGETLLQRTIRIAKTARLDPIFAVVNPSADWVSSLPHLGCEIVPNLDADEGLAASIRAGVQAALKDPQVLGAVLLTCDQVLLRAEHLRALYEHTDRITGSEYAGRTAVPAYFPRASFGHLLTLAGDAGARDLLQNAYAIRAEDLALDIDTEADLMQAQALLGRLITPR